MASVPLKSMSASGSAARPAPASISACGCVRCSAKARKTSASRWSSSPYSSLCAAYGRTFEPEQFYEPRRIQLRMFPTQQEQQPAIRSFVLDALWRLASRKDVSSIVINAHSNGTVIAFDALCSLPPAAASKIRALVTAGSP